MSPDTKAATLVALTAAVLFGAAGMMAGADTLAILMASAASGSAAAGLYAI